MSEGPVLALQGSRYLLFAPMVVIRSEGAKILSGHKRCHKLALGPADPANQRGRDCGRPGSKNKAVARRLDRRADPGEVLEQIVGKISYLPPHQGYVVLSGCIGHRGHRNS